jgi:hypothetical protein
VSSCPVCAAPSKSVCPHLALAAPATDFVRFAIEACHAAPLWRTVCRRGGDWDSTWLESSFCDRFLRGVPGFAGLTYEWRQGDQWALLWSSNPDRLWWSLRDRLEEEAANEGEAVSEVLCPVCGADCAGSACKHVAFDGDDLRTSEVVGGQRVVEALRLPEYAAAFLKKHAARFPSLLTVKSVEWCGGAPGLSGDYIYVFAKDRVALQAEISGFLAGIKKPAARKRRRR